MRGIWLVVHDQKNASDDLDDQDQQGQGTKEVKEVEVLRRVVLRQMLFVELRCGESVVYPIKQLFCCGRVGGNLFEVSHVVVSDQAFLSSPISNLVSDRYMCGGISRLSGAGLFL